MTASRAEALTGDRVREALGRVRYPGLTRDLVRSAWSST